MQYELKKSLGQHFLKDEHICERIAAKIQEQLQKHSLHQLLEVGPGAGALTKYLIQWNNIDFKAVELDREKVTYLLHKYPQLENKILENNFLDIAPPFNDPFLLAGNFPYNISSQIVFKMLEWKNQVPIMVGMFQKEVAQRIAAQPGSKAYGILSVLSQAHYEATYLFDVAPEAFNPPPQVMSGVILLKRKATELSYVSEKKFITLVKTAFGQRRKMLRNPLKPLFNADVLQQEIFSKRPEQLSLDDFANLTHLMK